MTKKDKTRKNSILVIIMGCFVILLIVGIIRNQQNILQFASESNLSSDERTRAIEVFNSYRQAIGLPLVEEKIELSQMAQLHAIYMAKNQELTHFEDKSNPFYSEDGDKSGQSSNLMGVVTTGFNDAVSGFFNSTKHRYGMLNPTLRYTGFGFEEGYAAIDVLEGRDDSSYWDNWPIVYPYHDQINVPVHGFVGGPYSNCFDGQSKSPTSYDAISDIFPITLQFASFSHTAPTLSNITLKDENEKVYNVLYCLPNPNEYYNLIGIFTREYLETNKRYTLLVEGTTHEDKPYSKTIVFSTEVLPTMTPFPSPYPTEVIAITTMPSTSTPFPIVPQISVPAVPIPTSTYSISTIPSLPGMHLPEKVSSTSERPKMILDWLIEKITLFLMRLNGISE